MSKKNCIEQKYYILQCLSEMFYAKMPNYDFLFSNLEFILILWHFVKALGPQVCLWPKICMELKDYILPFKVIWCKNAKFQLFILQTCIYLDFMAFCRGPRALVVRLIKEFHKSWVYYFEFPHNFAFMHQVRIPTFYIANLYLPWFSQHFAEALGPRGSVGLKSGIKAGCTILRSPTTLL